MEWSYRLYKDGDKYKGFNFDYNIDGRDMIISQWNPKVKFCKFDNLWEVYNYMIQGNDHLFECIVGDKKQKPYFDIDIKDTPNTIENIKKFDRMIDNLVNKLDSILNDVSHKCDILVFESHRSDKLSYHVVVDGIYLESNLHNRTFCCKHITRELQPHFDELYSSLQQFRLYGCSKYGKDNRKEKSNLSICHIPKDVEFRHLYIFTKSIVTDTEKCVLFPIELSNSIKRIQYKKMTSHNFYVNKAMFMLDVYYKGIFQIKNVSENNQNIIVELISTEPYMCLTHKREHENENGFICIEKRHWGLYFDCRRGGKKERLWMGNVMSR